MQTMNATALEKPTKEQIEEMTHLSVEAFTGDPLTDTLTGGIRELREEYFRLTFRAAALEGRTFVIQQLGSNKIVSVAIAFGPGIEFLGSEAQRALGFDPFFKSLPEDTRTWWKEVLMNPNRRKNPKIKEWWKLWLVATVSSERKQGYGTSVVKEILKLVTQFPNLKRLNVTDFNRQGETDDVSVGTNAAPEANIPFYEGLGFKTFDSNVDSSPFGTWVNTRMVWEPRK